ncbi:protein SCAR2-like isoform X2 [Actinidia eriantha]|uniref:protein SCAR2-like isoform X2 n=1 Tax=Actinidia eriantha TaxID=165200 RepID=UPI002584ECC1|nr:protein SCAR2-like isoform X2 [Actinidia eriantha]
MPLTRYQIRRAYSLADPELYVAADKDDPEALLEGVAMAGLVGVLRQLGDLSEFAAEIFHNLHEEVMTTAARGHGLMTRVQQVEAEFPTIEKALLSQTSHSSLFYNTGVDWHPNLHMDQNLITQGDLPRFVMDSYEECQGPPRLFLLDKFDVAGAGACLKRYTDPSFFKVDSPSSGITNADVQRDKKTRKAKKKGSRWRNGETPEVLPKSHAKLHQLFLVESVENHINDPARRVKLKRRLNGFPFDAKTGKSYMEKFLKAPKPDHNVVREICVNSSPLKLPSNTDGESGIEILEICTVSPEKELSLRKRSPCSSPDLMETGEKPSIYQLNEEVDREISEVSGRNPVCEIDNVLSTLHEDFHEREMADDGERKIECVDGYRSDDVASEVDNYTDALTTMDSEIETDTERRAKNYLHSLNIENQGMESDANEEQHDLQARFSDSQSTGSSTATDEGNSSSRKEISSLSYSDSISELAENTLSDDDVSAKILPSTGICEEIVDMSFDRQSVNGESSSKQVPEHVVFNGVCIEEAHTGIFRSQYGKPSYSSWLTDSTHILLPVDPEKRSNEGASVGLELDEMSSDRKELQPADCNPGENMTCLGDILRSTSNRSDDPSQEKDDFLPEMYSESHSLGELNDEGTHILSPALLHHSCVLELAHGKNSSENSSDDMLQVEYAEDECPKISVDSQMDLSHSFASHVLEQHLDSALPELETYEQDKKPEGVVSEASDALYGEIAISSLPTVDIEQAIDFSKQHFPGISENVPLLELDSAEAGSSYSGEENLDGTSNAAVSEELGVFSPEMDMFGEFSDDLKFPSEFQKSADPSIVPEGHLDLLTGTVHSEVVTVASDGAGTHCDDNGDDGKYLSVSHTKMQEESISVLQGSCQNVMEANVVCSPEHLQESATEKEVDNQAVASSDLHSVCTKMQEESISVLQGSRQNVMEANGVCSPDHLQESATEKEIANATTVPLSTDQNVQYSESKSSRPIDVIETANDAIACNTVSCDASCSELNDVPDSVMAPISGNGLQIANATTVPLSADQHDQYSESKSSRPIDVIETANDAIACNTVSCDASCSELNDIPDSVMAPISGNGLQIANATTVPLSADQHDQYSESKSSWQIDVIETANDAISSTTHHTAELRPPVEQNVDLQDDQFDAESQHDQNSEPKSSQQINVVENVEDAVPLPILHIAELGTHLEQTKRADKASSEPFSMVKRMQSPDHLDQERHNDTSSKFYDARSPSQFPVSNFFPQLAVSEQANNPSSSVLPPFSLLPEVSQLSLGDIPPLPPLPPMQWRIGKVQHVSLASERDLVGNNLDFFPQISASRVNENAQLGHPSIEGEITQPPNPFLPLSTLKDENSLHGYENLASCMVHPDPSSLQMPGKQNSSKEDFPTSDTTHSTNTFEKSEHGFLASDGRTTQPSVNPFSPAINGEDTVFTFPSTSLPDKTDHPLHQSAAETSSEDEKLQGCSVISKGKVVNPPENTYPPPILQDDHPQLVFSTSEVQTAWSSSTSILHPPVEEKGKPNGILQTKLPWPRNPLIDAVVAHDKSKLRKVTERIRPHVGQKIEERDSLLEQIRTKSFNLKPAVLTRPSIQGGPKTNLKVSAILEKANAIRQAFAGSDEDEDDEDSWSDS